MSLYCIIQADKYVHISKTPFPDLTICPTNPYKEELLIKNGIASREEYRWDAKWNSNDSSVLPKQLFNSIGNSNLHHNLLSQSFHFSMNKNSQFMMLVKSYMRSKYLWKSQLVGVTQ